VTFLNGNNHTNPPRWDIKNTQDFINHTSSNNAKIFKVPRKLNTTAHVSASQALTNSFTIADGLQFTCSNHHVSVEQ
jgi:hypothetical protein